MVGTTITVPGLGGGWLSGHAFTSWSGAGIDLYDNVQMFASERSSSPYGSGVCCVGSGSQRGPLVGQATSARSSLSASQSVCLDTNPEAWLVGLPAAHSGRLGQPSSELHATVCFRAGFLSRSGLGKPR